MMIEVVLSLVRKSSRSGGGGVDGDLLDTADTNAISEADSDIARLTPAGAPGVSDDVVVSAVANSGDGVVKSGTAGGSSDDTTGVVAEDVGGSINGHRHGAGVDGGLEGGKALGGDLGVRGGGDLAIGGVVLAGLVSGVVRVAALVLELVGGTVLEDVLLPATIAATAGRDAIDGLLLSEVEELARLDLVAALNGGGGGESPAGTARALVTDGTDGTLGSPVDGGVELGLINEVGGGLELGHVLVSETAELGLLLLGHGGEHVVADGGGLGRNRVVGLDESLSNLEEVLSEVVLLNGTVGESVLSDVLHELEVVGLNSGGDTGEGKGDVGFHG